MAEDFKDWLPKVLQYTKPYLSSQDIEKGERFLPNINKALGDTDYGITFLNPKNIDSPWVNFEAGSLSKNVLDSKVSTVLYDINPTDITGPMHHFQATAVENKEDVKALIRSINESCPDEFALDAIRLDEVFEVWWPMLEKKVGEYKPTDVQLENTKVREDSNLTTDDSGKLNLIIDMLMKSETNVNRSAIGNKKIFKELISIADEQKMLLTELDLLTSTNENPNGDHFFYIKKALTENTRRLSNLANYLSNSSANAKKQRID